jgi:hypothetical protein
MVIRVRAATMPTFAQQPRRGSTENAKTSA